MSAINSIELDLYVRDASNYRPATVEETLCAARRVLAQRFRPGRSLRSPELVQEYLRFALASKEHEVFCLICLDARHRLLGMVELFRGTVDGAQVHPREVVKESLRQNAVSVILAHNHPSGVAEPSSASTKLAIEYSPGFQLAARHACTRRSPGSSSRCRPVI